MIELNKKVEEALQLYMDCNQFFISQKTEVKKKEEELKTAKKYFNRALKNRKRARLVYEKAERKQKTYSSTLRSWNKKNMGKVLERMQ